MKLLDANGLKADAFVRADAPAVADALLVPLEALDAALAARRPGQRLGVELPNTFAAAALQPVQDALDLVAIVFPGFGDGRGFSIGRALREQGYAGTLRATGPLIPDQFAFALQCGFDEVEIGEEQAARQPVGQWLADLNRISATYNRGRPQYPSSQHRSVSA